MSSVHENSKLRTCWEHVVYLNCFFVFVLTFRTIYVHNMFSTCSELVIFMYWTRNSMNNLSSYCGLRSWCKNKCFSQRFTCTQGYWPKVQRFCGQMQPPALDCDDYYFLVLFLCCLSISFIFAAPIHIGKFFVCLIFAWKFCWEKTQSNQ